MTEQELLSLEILPGNLLLPLPENTSSVNIWSFLRIKYPRLTFPAYSETYRESFIGMLTNEEADEMRKKLKIFKKRFNDDFARRNKILFERR